MKSAKENHQKSIRIEGGAETFLLKANPFSQISALAKGRRCFSQDIQLQKRMVFACPGSILVKDHFQAPVELVFNRPVFTYQRSSSNAVSVF